MSSPATPRTPNSFRQDLEKVKAELTTEEYLRSRGVELKRDGLRLVACCPIPGHEDKTPSFHVWTETGRWHCFGACSRGGDLLDAFMLIEGWPEDAYGEALAALAERYGVELPGRPDSWFRRQERQKKVRDSIDAEKVEHVRQLLFRLVWMPWLRRLPEWSRAEATESAWGESLPLARLLYESRRGA